MQSSQQYGHPLFHRHRHQWVGSGATPWSRWGLEDCSLFAGVVLTIASAPLLLAWMGASDEVWMVGVLGKSRIGLAFSAGILLFNGWLLDRYLSSKTFQEWSMPRWLLGMRLASCCLPLFGVYALPAWRWIVRQRPSWTVGQQGWPRLDLSLPVPGTGFPRLPRIRFESLFRIIQPSRMALWLRGCHALMPFTAASWLLEVSSSHPAGQSIRAAGLIAFQLLSFGCMLCFAISRSRALQALRGRKLALHLFPAFFLIPLAGGLFSAMAWLWFGEERREDQTLARTVYERRSSADVLRGWAWPAQGAEAQSPRPAGRNQKPAEPNLAELRLLTLCRLKTILLALDGVWLTWLILPPSETLTWTQAAGIPLQPLWVLAGLGLALQGAGWILAAVKKTGSGLIRSGRYLCLTQIALLAGILSGSLAAVQDYGVLAFFVMALSGASFLLSALLFNLKAIVKGTSRALEIWAKLWLVGCLAVFVAALVLFARRDVAQAFAPVFRTAILLAPFWHLALGARLGDWLLRPFHWSHLRGPDLPGLPRSALAVLAATALLPLGGLAIPLWFPLRRWIAQRKGDFPRSKLDPIGTSPQQA